MMVRDHISNFLTTPHHTTYQETAAYYEIWTNLFIVFRDFDPMQRIGRNGLSLAIANAD